MADTWVLLYNGETTIEDIAGGSGKKITIREPTTYGTFLRLVKEIDNA